MNKTVALVAISAIASLDAGAESRASVKVPSGEVMQFRAFSELSSSDLRQIREHATSTIPTFSGSFEYNGKTYNYTMAGGAPEAGGSTTIPVVIQPVKFIFEGTTDPATGNPYVLDGTDRVDDVVNSPNFQPADYSIGSGLQFQDAVQNAQFYSVRGADYHLLLGTPKVLKTQTIDVPAGKATIVVNGAGVVEARLNFVYFYELLYGIRYRGGFKSTELPLVLTDNVLLYEFPGTSSCCVVGFHSAYPSIFGKHVIAWASYIRPDTFGNNSFVDVTGISHEIAELVNDPYVTNWVPSWTYPGGTACSLILETGDPVESLANPTFPVAIGNTTYHPQTEAMLQWFERASPSGAFGNAYSYPNMTDLTAPAKDCGS